MTSIKETRDFFLLSYETGLIYDDDFFLVYPSYISQNLDLPFKSFSCCSWKEKELSAFALKNT